MQTGTARGFRDILPDEARARERISAAVRDCLDAQGYAPVETPLLERLDALERGGRLRTPAFQLFDADGGPLVLRPDLTQPLVRLVAERAGADDLPLRLRYQAPVVRESPALAGQPRQFTQLGAEFFDARGSLPDVEVIKLLALVLDALAVPDWRVVCGSVTPLLGLLDACAPSQDFRRRALALVHESDLPGLDALVASSPLDGAAARALWVRLRHWLCGRR
ncbi:ATP phosphoribosyltransferase regulatory subunit, partial [Olsenella massiliensis]|uniref:ATP phosphoribosyltransferase regulatory subunit n=1 Tax=Olsenella massiliensis TaxID=1622075 RepID=UPI0018D26FC3